MLRTIPRVPSPSLLSQAIPWPRSSTARCKLGAIPWRLRSRIAGPSNVTTVFVTQMFAELNPDFHDPAFGGNGEGRELGKQGVVQASPAGNANPPITKIVLKPLQISGFNANRMTPNNFCNTVPPAQSNIFCPNPADPT